MSYYSLLGMPTLRWKDKEKHQHLYSNKHSNNREFHVNEVFNDISLKHSPKEKDNIWKNKLILGDNKLVMENLINNSQKVDLIYIDPPFATGGNFNYKIHIGEKGAPEVVKSYSDKWKGGIDSYLNFLYKRLQLMKNLLSETGSIYLHLDWHISHYVKIILDEIFGEENFRNEIIWVYPAASAKTRNFFIRSYDVILFYTKNVDKYVFNDDPNVYMEYSDRVKNALKEDENGVFYYRGGSHNGKKLSRKVYIKQDGIFPRDFWYDVPYVRANTAEYQGFSTQKPERLLKRIILSSTNENDLVADFFCGSGTTLSVAEKLGRRWIGCDSKNHAIHMGRKRLLNINNSYNLFTWKKKYEHSLKPFQILSLEAVHNRGFLHNKLMEDGENFELETNIKTIKPKVSIKIHQNEHKIFLELKDYSIPFIDKISNKIREKVKIFSDWIDYWAIDFNYSQEIFNINWTSFRTPKKRNLDLRSIEYSYVNPGKHHIAIMLIDILGIESIHIFEI